MFYKKCYLYSFLLLFLFTSEATQKLRVLFCVKSFPSYTSWFILNQITEFIRQGHDVTILARDHQLTTVNNTHPEIIHLRLLEKTYINTLPEHKHSFDIILCQFSSLAPYVIDFTEKYHITGKLFVFVRGAFCYRKKQHEKIRKKIFEKTDMFLSVCEFSKNQLVALGCDPKKIKIVHSTIDTHTFSYTPRQTPKDTIHIITTSRLSEQKGLEYAIKAVKDVLKQHPNCDYTIIGDGKIRKKIEQLIINFDLEKKIFLLGWKKPDEIIAILDNSHIFLHPSITTSNGGSEGIPTSIMEAMALGIPVVATAHAGIPELIENDITGFLVPEKNSKELAEKVVFLIKNQKLWNKIGIAGRKAVEKEFDKTTENQKFINFCKKYVFSQ
jgi:colanic acid/amylovoran biosynthesis glycosyltransferase